MHENYNILIIYSTSEGSHHMNAIGLIEDMVGSPPIQEKVSIISYGEYRKCLGLMHIHIMCPIAQDSYRDTWYIRYLGLMHIHIMCPIAQDSYRDTWYIRYITCLGYVKQYLSYTHPKL